MNAITESGSEKEGYHGVMAQSFLSSISTSARIKMISELSTLVL